MTIQEALKANETQKVRLDETTIYPVDLLRKMHVFSHAEVFGEWTVVREPEVLEFEIIGELPNLYYGKLPSKMLGKHWRVRCEEIVE